MFFILEKSLFLKNQIYALQIFSSSLDLPLYFLKSIFWKATVMKSNLSNLFMVFPFCILRNPCLTVLLFFKKKFILLIKWRYYDYVLRKSKAINLSLMRANENFKYNMTRMIFRLQLSCIRQGAGPHFQKGWLKGLFIQVWVGSNNSRKPILALGQRKGLRESYSYMSGPSNESYSLW